jgi:microcin C transport system permease protein
MTRSRIGRLFRLNPINQRRWRNFKANRRGSISLWLFLVLFVFSLLAEFIANDRPLMAQYDGRLHVPVLFTYAETAFGGEFETEADYRDPYVQGLITEKGWMLWPPIRFRYDTVNKDTGTAYPSPPSADNPLGTDDQGRDIVARLIYGFRISVLFGLCLTLFSSLAGITVGAMQGYYGGWMDLIGQRFMEIWSGMPLLYILIILSSLIRPTFWWLLGIMLLFEWMNLVDLVRAEFLRGRNLEYVRAARALGLGDAAIMGRHILPNAMVATITFLPFLLNASITTLTSLDFLGLGLPPGSPSLGELLLQGKNNLQAPWIGLSAFAVVSVMLTLLVFIGEAARDAFDPRLQAAPEPGEDLGLPDEPASPPAVGNGNPPVSAAGARS